MREVYLQVTQHYSIRITVRRIYLKKLHSPEFLKKKVINEWLAVRWLYERDVGPECGRGEVRWWGVHGISIQGTAHSTTWRHGSPRDRDWRVVERERHAESPLSTSTSTRRPYNCRELTLLSTHTCLPPTAALPPPTRSCLSRRTLFTF